MVERNRLPDLHGLLIVDKPAGWTSHDVVARVRRLVGMKRVGHGGTLDPFATGVVVVAVGRATRLLQYVQDSDKRYLAHVVLGATTDTLDVDGEVVNRISPPTWPDRADVDHVVSSFIGTIEQLAPAYSAIKVQGRKLYEMARAGETVVAPTRTVRIDAITVLAYDPPDLILDVECGKGTYIRSIARDIGDRLGTGAYCHALRRVRNGAFTTAEAWQLDEMAGLDVRERWADIAVHPDRAVADRAAVVMGEDGTAAWYHGRPAPLGARVVRPDAGTVRVYAADGRFGGIGTLATGGVLRPEFVFVTGEGGSA